MSICIIILLCYTLLYLVQISKDTLDFPSPFALKFEMYPPLIKLNIEPVPSVAGHPRSSYLKVDVIGLSEECWFTVETKPPSSLPAVQGLYCVFSMEYYMLVVTGTTCII